MPSRKRKAEKRRRRRNPQMPDVAKIPDSMRLALAIIETPMFRRALLENEAKKRGK